MRKRGELWSRLDALEAQLISPLQQRIDALSDNDRATYDRWKRQCHAQFAAYRGEPGTWFEKILDGEIVRPELPCRLRQKLFPTRIPIYADAPLADVADRYREILEQIK